MASCLPGAEHATPAENESPLEDILLAPPTLESLFAGDISILNSSERLD
jgi:hypothetical protein